MGMLNNQRVYIYIFIYLNFPRVQSIGMTKKQTSDQSISMIFHDQELMGFLLDVHNLRPRGYPLVI